MNNRNKSTVNKATFISGPSVLIPHYTGDEDDGCSSFEEGDGDTSEEEEEKDVSNVPPPTPAVSSRQV